jgi:hypothetical protein
MGDHISQTDATAALRSIEHSRQQVLAEIDMPRWYWWALAAGWVVVGVVADAGRPWLSAAATLVFGAAHASVAPRVLSGRHGSPQLSIRADMVSRHVPALVIGFLLVMGAATVVLGFAAEADGAGHPATIASIVVAVAVGGGGPALMAGVRRRARARS